MRADVVIVGGGFCGIHVAKQLDKLDLSVVLIDERSKFEFTPAIPKLITNPGHYKKIQIPFNSLFKNVKFVNERILRVNEKEVITEQKSIFTFKYLIISAGSTYPVPFKDKQSFKLKNSWDAIRLNRFLENSKTVVIAGGGLIGTELAGELVTKTNKKVTVIETGSRLLGRNTESASNWAYDFLKKRGCNIIFGEKIVDRSDGSVLTDKGNKVSADLLVWCAGIKSNSSFITGKLSKSLNERKSIRVNDFLQVKNFKNIFCGGDLSDVPEEKTAQNADRHARVIVHNLKVLFGIKKSMVAHKPRSGPLVISLGDWHGLFVFKNFVFKGFIPGLMKHIIEKMLILQVRYL